MAKNREKKVHAMLNVWSNSRILWALVLEQTEELERIEQNKDNIDDVMQNLRKRYNIAEIWGTRLY